MENIWICRVFLNLYGFQNKKKQGWRLTEFFKCWRGEIQTQLSVPCANDMRCTKEHFYDSRLHRKMRVRKAIEREVPCYILCFPPIAASLPNKGSCDLRKLKQYLHSSTHCCISAIEGISWEKWSPFARPFCRNQ